MKTLTILNSISSLFYYIINMILYKLQAIKELEIKYLQEYLT